MFNERGIEERGEQLSIIWTCEISDTIAGSGPQHSQFSSKARQVITDHSSWIMSIDASESGENTITSISWCKDLDTAVL